MPAAEDVEALVAGVVEQQEELVQLLLHPGHHRRENGRLECSFLNRHIGQKIGQI
jgi:hypothetical protein